MGLPDNLIWEEFFFKLSVRRIVSSQRWKLLMKLRMMPNYGAFKVVCSSIFTLKLRLHGLNYEAESVLADRVHRRT